MISARRKVIAVMGAWMGAAGIEHGVGEILQVNAVPTGMMILSWPESPFFQSLGGEPAMTVIPNLLATGILAIIFSTLFGGWAIFFAPRKRGGGMLMLLAVPMLLFGGGIFPPVLGALIGAAAAAFGDKPVVQTVSGLRRKVGKSWRWIFTACCTAWLALLPGIAALGYFFKVDNAYLTLAVMISAFGLLFLSFWSSVLHDCLPPSASIDDNNVVGIGQPEGLDPARSGSI